MNIPNESARGRIVKRTQFEGLAKAHRDLVASTFSYGVRDNPVRGSVLVIVKVTGNRTGGGKYAGKIVRAVTATLSYSGNLAASDIADDADAPDCTLINPHEQGQSTHALTASPQTCVYYTAARTWQLDEDDLPVLRIIDGFDAKAC